MNNKAHTVTTQETLDMQCSMHAVSKGHVYTARGHVQIAVDFPIVNAHIERRDMDTQQAHTDTQVNVKGHVFTQPAPHRGSEPFHGACPASEPA